MIGGEVGESKRSPKVQDKGAEFYAKCNRELLVSLVGRVVTYLQDSSGCCAEDGLWKGKSMAEKPLWESWLEMTVS